MKRTWMVVGFLAVCTPMLLSMLLLLAVVWPKMDALTRHTGQEVRSMVARGILSTHPIDKAAQQRSESLSPGVVALFKQQSARVTGVKPLQNAAELNEMYAQQRADKQKARALSDQADVQMKGGHGCEAEDLYAKAGNLDQSVEVYRHTEGVGRAALVCGDLAGARAGLEAAILKETNFLRGTEDDQLMDIRRARAMDRQFLVVVYQRQHEAKQQQAACRVVDPQWNACACELKAGNTVSCQGH